MRIELYKIRLDERHYAADKEKLNALLDSVNVQHINTQFLPDKECWTVVVAFDLPKTKQPEPPQEPLTPDQQHRFDMLRQWRHEKAQSLGIAAFVVASNRELVQIACTEIDAPNDLLAIKGFRERKVAAYGAEIVALLNSI